MIKQSVLKNGCPLTYLSDIHMCMYFKEWNKKIIIAYITDTQADSLRALYE